jgi:hypothetical protein
MEINITPGDVEKMVKDSLVKAGLGKAITEAIQKALTGSYNNPIDEAIKRF